MQLWNVEGGPLTSGGLSAQNRTKDPCPTQGAKKAVKLGLAGNGHRLKWFGV